ncbi:DUF4214 domain-containing protein [Duganella sp. HH105]|uniref:DUF4214 domain-containing protein n=1 Tax=Duganella sp. HH105 TaxID=1781067 RepID=UPI000877D8D0|nr:DUF4214 domain-containing protein [Duganella sp. HH105]OEZ56299.1 hypothetical protein DUGA6_50790 [Duganella sp. HH105]
MSDDFSNDINTTGRLVVGSGASGNFETSYDGDWFRVQLTAGLTYVFTLNGAAQDGGTPAGPGGTSLTLYGGQGQWLMNRAGTADYGPALTLTATASGTYFLAAGANGGGDSVGSYTVTASLPAQDDFRANIGSSGNFAGGDSVSGVFERSDDVDWFQFHAEAGQMLAFTSTGAGAMPADTSVYDASGRYVTYASNYPVKITASGDYYLAVASKGYVGNYTQTMRVLTDDFPADGPGKLAVGGALSGALDYNGDYDAFAIDVEAGQIYTLTLDTPAGDNRTIAAYVADSRGSSRSYGAELVNHQMVIRFLADKADTYTLRLNSYADLSTPMQYTVRLGAPEADDYGSTRATAQPLELDVTLNGRLQSPDDLDVFKTELAAGVTYTFSIDADAAAPQGSQRYQLVDDSGYVVASPRYESGPGFSYTPAKGGAYFLQLSYGYSSLPANGVSYSVSASKTVDDYGATVATAGRLVVGSAIKAELEAGGGDRDWFAVGLEAGQAYWFTLKGLKEGAGTLDGGYGNAVYKLLDGAGKVVATADSGGGSATAAILPYTPAVKGTYYLEVSAPQLSGTYTVAARYGLKDDYGNDAAHAGAIQAGVPLKGTLELASDRDVLKLSAVAGETYALELAPTDANGSTGNYYLTLGVADGNGGYVYTRSLHVGNNKVYQLLEAKQSGDYYLTVGASGSGSGGLGGGYKLTATGMGRDDYTASTDTTAVLAPGAALSGAIGVFDDHDWIKVHLEAGRTYVFDLRGKASGGGSLDTSSTAYSGMMLLNGYGGSQAYGVNVGGDQRISYIAATTGDYYLDVRGSADHIGTYTVEATKTSGDLAAPLLLSASIAPEAVDVPLAPRITLTFNETIMLGSGVTLTDSLGRVVQAPGGVATASAVGHTLVVDPHQYLKPGATYTLSLAEGSVLDLAGNHHAGGQSYTFTTVQPVAVGTDGNDYLLGTGGGMKLNGGAGLDTAYYSQGYYQTQVTRNADGSVSVRDYGAATGDTLTGIERLMFSERVLALDIDGAGGQAYRLYQAAFNRAPDVGGVGYWINVLDRGVSLKTVASGFIDSQEFRTLYGTAPTDQAFVTNLYNNVLHRAPDAGGSSFWMDRLHDGVSREDVLIGFSESVENQAAIAKIIGAGFVYTPAG